MVCLLDCVLMEPDLKQHLTSAAMCERQVVTNERKFFVPQLAVTDTSANRQKSCCTFNQVHGSLMVPVMSATVTQ